MDDLRICRGPCGRELPLDAEHFHRKGRGVDGQQLYESTCAECLRPIKAARMRGKAKPSQRSYQRAMHELRRRHPAEFHRILTEMRETDG
jgi:hypothetical protein